MEKHLVILTLVLITSGCTAEISYQNKSRTTASNIVEIVDGDTVDIKLGNQTSTVRLLGVDTPEIHVENSPEEFEKIPENKEGRKCLEKWGHKASEFAKEKLSGKNVTSVTDPKSDTRGSYGRLLGYIKINGTNFNYLLVKKGYARVYESGFSKQKKFLEAEHRAQEKLKGLWQCRSYRLGNLKVN